MKKKLILPLILLLFLNIHLVSSPYNITPNQTFEYNIKKATISLKSDGNFYSGKGFKINDVKFNQGSNIQAYVQSLGEDNVLWTLTSGDESQAKIADWDLVDEISLSYTILNPLSTIEDFLVNPLLANDGLGLIFYPFLGTNRTIEYFKALKNETHYLYNFFITKVFELTFVTHYEEQEQMIVFESLITGRMKQNLTSPLYEIYFSHHYQTVYDVSIGLLYGSRIISEGSGIFMNKTINYNFESLIEIANYNLPRLKFSSDYLLKWWLIGICSGSIVTIMSIFIIRYRRKNIK